MGLLQLLSGRFPPGRAFTVREVLACSDDAALHVAVRQFVGALDGDPVDARRLATGFGRLATREVAGFRLDRAGDGNRVSHGALWCITRHATEDQ
jgi:hypothetical protein